ncbi:PucR family transcriptional regulator [Paenibacillus sedimenti]|uniref:PucR family transcriptional regulator n=1 Tax=Paenibacillus sedimenti TaxID=2770274 RepID=A0A926KXC1_9BACL|nr:PucR family transcriptional regulator [Paenibacillus sedimenti]MBD0383963.1 PucR family transcriptional regulator [Paenibacillus sedimenti]
MRLSELLDLPVFNGASLVAGNQGIEREVNTVNMMDAPDIIHFLKKNELLVTTAFHFKDDLHSLLHLIKEMEKQDCSGLGIKTKRFLDQIPDEAVSLANELQLPLLELPIQTSLGDIVNKSLSHILDIRTNELHNAMQTHQQFTNHIMSGQGINKILESLSSLIHLPVVLLNHHLRPAVNNFNQPSIFEHLETLITSGHHLHFSKTTISTFSLLNETRDTITLFPVYSHKQYSYLCILGFIPLSDRSTFLTVEQATNVIAFELMKENALKQNRRRIENEFFTNFINGSFSTNEEIISRGKEFGLLNEQRYVCAVGKLDITEKNISFMQYQSEQELIYDKIESELQLFHQKIHLFTTDHSYILLMQLKGGWKDIEQPFFSLLETLQTKIAIHCQEELSFGISNYAQQLIHIPISYKEATDALYYGNMSGKKKFIEIYQPKEVPEILRMVPYEHLIKFYSDTFQAFANDPNKDHQILLQTLSVYLETHCHLAETAKRLYVHRNTVIYRLEKCEEIIGRSLKEADETLRLRLAFRIKALIQGNSTLDHKSKEMKSSNI